MDRPGEARGARRLRPLLTASLLGALAAPGLASGPPASGEHLYRAACAACHGVDGTGAPVAVVAFPEPLPDFSDCRFARREPDGDWIAVAHDGGPVRGFAAMMPAFGEALGADDLQRIMDHVRGFCSDAAWPRGELNLPRPLVTEKAYPEDELVFATAVAGEGTTEVESEIVYEKRFGPRNQVEIVLPFAWREGAGSSAGMGDVAVGVKRALYHDHRRGSIFSATAEVILPTGDEDEGFGKGYAVFEPFLTFGQILPRDAFLQLQLGLELPDDDLAHEEAFGRLALGRSFVEGRWGRTWSPMVELLGKRELASGETTLWDALPQVQVTLNTRQHVMASFGVRFPLNETGGRDHQFLAYLLWDWFDGGFLAGW